MTRPHAFPQARLRSVVQLGFSLVEVLVAMFVVAMGILALAGLLQAATRYSKMSELRSTATLLANDIADRIRANPVGGKLAAAGYDITEKSIPTSLSPAHAACTSEAPCGPSDLAKADLADWTARVRTTLPKGSAWIQFHVGNAPAPDYLDVWVGWADPLTLAPGISTDRSGTECPASWKTVEASVRCVYLQVAL
ncbi:MAG: type IV pilus modification protein PilV [Burkholderiaceae bacterium]